MKKVTIGLGHSLSRDPVVTYYMSSVLLDLCERIPREQRVDLLVT